MRSAPEQGAPRELLGGEARELARDEDGEQAGRDAEGEAAGDRLGGLERSGCGGEAGGFQGAV
jgi:hypothetical protein